MDDALVLARDQPAAAAAAVFPGGAHVLPITPAAATVQGISSLGTDSVLLAQGAQAGVNAVHEVLSQLSSWLEEEQERAGKEEEVQVQEEKEKEGSLIYIT
mmetsp:Transcript_28445/g.70077  ORF Transcript_28445/g.70077 Transcript_28445/m.70077 type:complete len:101 (-) Transcript_28445:340-642(-)